MLLDDRPLLLVSGHFGNFELAGFVLGILGFPTYTVARPLDNPYLHAFVNRFRGATGQHIVPTKGATTRSWPSYAAVAPWPFWPINTQAVKGAG